MLGVPEVLVDIIRSFHDDMEARVSLNHLLLEEINEKNGLCQGYTMAPTLFNLYACAVVERWLKRIEEVGTVCMCCTRWRNSCLEETLHNNIAGCQLADDVVLLASSQEAVEVAINILPISNLAVTLNFTTFSLCLLGVTHFCCSGLDFTSFRNFVIACVKPA